MFDWNCSDLALQARSSCVHGMIFAATMLTQCKQAHLDSTVHYVGLGVDVKELQNNGIVSKTGSFEKNGVQ